MTKTKMTFEEWKTRVDDEISKRVGLGIDDLPDLVDARLHYDEGTTPRLFAIKAIRACEGGGW